MSPKRSTNKKQEPLPMNFEAANIEPESTSEPEPQPNGSKKKRSSDTGQQRLFESLADLADVEEEDVEEPVTDLVPTSMNPLGFLETETVNALVAMAGLSTHTQRAYQRWIVRYLADANRIDRRKIDLKELNVALAVNSLGTAMLKAWLGHLKSKKLGKQSIMQAKPSVVWLAQLVADLERADHSIAHGLSPVKAPRAESRQREGTWLTQTEVRQLVRALRRLDAENSACVARKTAIGVR